jgi:clan AA aspartic protease
MPMESIPMGEIRTKLLLTNAVDEALASLGKLPFDQVRRMEVDAVVDTGAVSPVLTVHVVDQLGLLTRGNRVAQMAGRNEVVGVTGPVVFEIQTRNTIEEALILDDEVLVGQTVLEKLDLLADCANQRLIPNPAHPAQPVLKVRRRSTLHQDKP